MINSIKELIASFKISHTFATVGVNLHVFSIRNSAFASKSHGKIGVARVTRDDNQKLVSAFGNPIHSKNIKEAEIKAVREGLQLFLHQNIRKLEVELKSCQQFTGFKYK